jgi:pimeloyl-ACP methyl ester carboxylesterase
MKNLCLCLLLIITVFKTYSQDLSLDLKPRYDSARIAFENFESKHGGFVTTRNVRMHYLEWGNPKDVPLIWAHGSFTNGYELMDIADKLTAKGYYLIAIDYYGHGQTKIPEHEVSLYHVADDIKALMEAKKIKKAVIGGWSRGGSIATAFYDTYPESVSGLVLEDGGSVAVNSHYQQMPKTELKSRIKAIFKDKTEYGRFDTEFEAYKAYYDYSSGGLQFELLAWLNKDREGKWSIGAGLEELFHMKTAEQFLGNILRPAQSTLFARSMAVMEPEIIYRNLDVPMLILDPISDQDIQPFEKANEKLRSLHRELITHKIYEQTGHNIHYEKPDAFVTDVGEFLKIVKKHKKK